MSKILVFKKSHFGPKIDVFEENGPKITFGPMGNFHIMPNIKVDIISHLMTYDVGVCRVGTLNS